MSEKLFGIKKVKSDDGTIFGHLNESRTKWVKESSSDLKYCDTLNNATKWLIKVRQLSKHERYEYELTARTTKY